MSVTAAQARKLALSFEDASERPHVDRAAFRTSRRIFATLAGDGRDINLGFDPALQEFFCEQAPQAFTRLPGGWGEMGATRCDLRAVDKSTLQSALKAAHALAMPKPNKARK